MKKFMFRYESILKMRIDTEDEVKNKLAKVITELKILEKELDRIRAAEEEFSSQVAKKLEEGCILEELQRYEKNKSWMKNEIQVIIGLIVKKEQSVLDVRRELIEATKQKKIMEKLKDNDFEDYKQKVRIAEEKVTDQIVTYQNSSK